jgi:hypothetical protein
MQVVPSTTLHQLAKLHENYQACEDHATLDHKWDMCFKNHSPRQERHIGFSKFLDGGNKCRDIELCTRVSQKLSAM